MKCFVTGGSGFIGANLVHELIARGHEVKVLSRPGSDMRSLNGLDYQTVEGDLSNPESLRQAMMGCDWCFHTAAIYDLWLRNYKPMYATNVEGARTVIQAAARAGCSRIVHTSTVGCVGLPDETDGEVVPSDETAVATEQEMNNDYKRSKWQAEQVAVELFRKGLPVVIVNPTAPIGPLDSKPTPTGRFIVDYLNHALPAYMETGLNWVHVRDVAAGHVLAAEHGRLGERYILGNAEGNWTMKKSLEVLEQLSNVPSPRMKISYPLAITAAHVNEVFSFVTGKPPKAPVAGVRMARSKMFFDPSKAIRELGLPQTPPEQAFRDAIEWFRANGYVKQ